MGWKVMRTIATTAIAAALANAGMPALAQEARPTTAAEANALSAADAKAKADASRAAVAAVTASETPAQAKARLAAEKAAAKEAAKAKRDAERAARPKSDAGKKLARCAVGAIGGLVLARMLGGRSASALVGGAVAGCAVGGWALGAALKGNDEKKLTSYVDTDFAERDDLASDSWTAPESGTAITLQTLDSSYKPIEHKTGVAAGVDFDPANIRVAIVKMRVTDAISLRSSPSLYDGDNVIGGYGADEIVRAYGTTLDGAWTYLAEVQEDGSDLVVGYVPSPKLSTQLNKPRTAPLQIARAKPKPKAPVRAARAGKGRAPAKAAPAPVQVAKAATPLRQVAFSAPTRCKNIQATALGNTGRQSSCSGARNIA